MIRLLSAACVAAQVGLVVIWLVAIPWEPDGYSSLEHTVSDMYAQDAPHGAWVAGVITVCGLVTMAFALGVVPVVLRAAGARAWVSGILLALSIIGLGDALSLLEREPCMLATSGCSASDQLEGGGLADAILSGAGILVLVVLGFVLAATFKRAAGWESWARPARWASITVIVLVVVNGVAEGVDLGGLAERALIVFVAASVTAFAIRAARHAERGSRRPWPEPAGA
jgi:hypothetical protein